MHHFILRCVFANGGSVCDKSVRYVAEENIEPVSPDTEPSEAITRLAGRHFKRWDKESHLFVSNMRDEYPDD
jgi:F-box protein 21